MKAKSFFQALKFACIPTLSVLVLLFLGFFSVDKALTFITSDSTFATTLRVLLAIGEGVLLFVMYNIYLDKAEMEALEKGIANDTLQWSNSTIDGDRDIRQLMNGWNYSDKFVKSIVNDNIVVIKKVVKKDN